MADQENIQRAIEYAEEDAKYQFAPTQEEPLEEEFAQVQGRSPRLTYERWLKQVALFARRNNRAYQNEKFYDETTEDYDKAYIAAILNIDAAKFPKEQ